MRVSVGFLGVLRDQVGVKSLEVELADGAALADLMDAIAPTIDAKLGTWAWNAQTHRFSERVVVSRKNAVGKVDPEAPLSDGEEIVVFPPLAGG